MTSSTVPSLAGADMGTGTDDVVGPATATPVVRADGVSKVYGTGALAYTALATCSIALHAGELTAVLGPSGSGKSTLLHLVSTIDSPTTGQVWLGRRRVDRMPERDLARLRAREIGFVLQRDNLVPSLRLDENVAAPLMLSGRSRRESLARARELLDTVGLAHRSRALPGEVSGGEAQRAAVARACSARPTLVVADEPTGALDRANGMLVMELLQALTADVGSAVLLVTHDRDHAARAERTFTIVDGLLKET